MSEDKSVSEGYLDGEFQVYLKFSKHLLSKMKSMEDRKICAKYIRNCLSMKSSEALVKFHRNRFFRYLLKTMQKTVDNQKNENTKFFLHMPDHQHQHDNDDDDDDTTGANANEKVNDNKNDENEFIQWSANRKSYVSAKVLPGYGTLIFMACTDHPECGWDVNGFANFTQAQDISDLPKSPEQLFSNSSH